MLIYFLFEICTQFTYKDFFKKKQDRKKHDKMYQNSHDIKINKEYANKLDCIKNVYDMLLYSYYAFL